MCVSTLYNWIFLSETQKMNVKKLCYIDVNLQLISDEINILC